MEIAGIEAKWFAIVKGRPPLGLGVFAPVDPNALVDELEEEFRRTGERMPCFGLLCASPPRIVAGREDLPPMTVFADSTTKAGRHRASGPQNRRGARGSSRS
jgi:hypothetical protein